MNAVPFTPPPSITRQVIGGCSICSTRMFYGISRLTSFFTHSGCPSRICSVLRNFAILRVLHITIVDFKSEAVFYLCSNVNILNWITNNQMVADYLENSDLILCWR
jgi:hypothetical protein